jgi:hypothetical protein
MTEKLAYTLYRLENHNFAVAEYVTVSGKRSTIAEKTSVLVIEMINLFSLEIPKVMLNNAEWIKSFDHVIVNNAYEGPLKLLGQCPIDSTNQQPVYEFLMSFYNIFRPTHLSYFDNDISTDRSFLKWCRAMKIKKPPFVVKYIPNIHFSNLLLQSIAKTYSVTDTKDFFTNTWESLLPNQHTTLYWSFNRHRRWGRVFIFYMLCKANLLGKGIVSVHISHLNSRFINLAKQFGLTVSRQDLLEVNKHLPMSVDSGIVVSTNPNDLPTMRNDETLTAAINVCTETHCFEENLYFTEKTLKPILFRQVILPVASYGIFHKVTELYNFKFSPITYKIDAIKDPIQRLTATVDALQQFDLDPTALEQELTEVRANWQHNMKILIDHCGETQHTLIMRIINENITNRI